MSTPAFDASVPAGRLPSLTSLRWLAASLVFVSHARELLILRGSWFDRISEQGSSGVSFFFILSGFVLVWSAQSSTTARLFYLRRFARVYPAYFVVAVVAVPVIYLIGEIDSPAHLVQAVLPVSLLQAWFPHYRVVYSGNGVSWSLSCEAFFYLLFPLIVVPIVNATHRTRTVLLVACLAVPFVLGAALSPTEEQGWRYLVLYANPVVRTAEFAAGVVMGTMLRSGVRVRWLGVGPALGVVVAAYVAAGWTPLAYRTIAVTAIPFALLLFAAAQADAEGRTPRLLAAPWLITLGTWSYAFYLVHQLVIRIASDIIDPPDQGYGVRALAAVLTYVISIALSGLLYRFVEHPAERRIRELGTARLRAAAAAPA